VLVFADERLGEKMSGTALLAPLPGIRHRIMGISLSYIFLIYTESAPSPTCSSSWRRCLGRDGRGGYTTKTDLTKLGSILMIGLIGIVIASLVNMFIGSSTMDYIVSIIGVVIFTGLTAYDMQKLKRMGEVVATGTETAQKMASWVPSPLPGLHQPLPDVAAPVRRA
jgi:FtsH-binding integral membrane protein